MKQKKKKQSIRTKVWRDPLYFLACGFGSGLFPKAPGTAGTVAAIPVYLLLSTFNNTIYIALLVIMFSLGVWMTGRIANELGVKDDPRIVWDEIVGYCLAMFMAPVGVLSIVLGFIFFRGFDILKPYPIRLLDKHLTGGWGIMLDDIVAAIPAAMLLQLMLYGIRALGVS